MTFNKAQRSFFKRPDGSGSRVENINLMPFDGLPKAAHVWPRRNSFKNNGSATTRKGAVQNIRMTSDPAQVSRAPIHLTIAILKSSAERITDVHHVSTAGMNHTLRLSG